MFAEWGFLLGRRYECCYFSTSFVIAAKHTSNDSIIVHNDFVKVL